MKEKRARRGKIKVKLKKFYELFRGAKREHETSRERHVAGNERKILHSRHRRVKKTKATPDDLPLFQSLCSMFFLWLLLSLLLAPPPLNCLPVPGPAASKLCAAGCLGNAILCSYPRRQRHQPL